MMMPEGWKKMKICSETIKSFSLLPPSTGSVSIVECVDLLKEMAEALEDTCRSQPDKVNWIRANQVLDRFEDWK